MPDSLNPWSSQRSPGNENAPFTGQGDWRTDLLVIDDDVDSAERVCRELQANGFNAVAAFSGEEGLALLNSRAFGLVLLDWMLPDCTGIEVLKTLRARDDRTPVFLMSVLDALEDRIFGFESGADD